MAHKGFWVPLCGTLMSRVGLGMKKTNYVTAWLHSSNVDGCLIACKQQETAFNVDKEKE